MVFWTLLDFIFLPLDCDGICEQRSQGLMTFLGPVIEEPRNDHAAHHSLVKPKMPREPYVPYRPPSLSCAMVVTQRFFGPNTSLLFLYACCRALQLLILYARLCCRYISRRVQRRIVTRPRRSSPLWGPVHVCPYLPTCKSSRR